MGRFTSLPQYLGDWVRQDPARSDIAETVLLIASAAIEIAELIGEGPLAGDLGAVVRSNRDGDAQKSLDVRANELVLRALRGSPVAIVGSEENEDAVVLSAEAPLAVALDPLDGSSNIDTNVPTGTIFSICHVEKQGKNATAASLLKKGAEQLAAGFAIYGPHTSLVLTVRQGVQIFVLDRKSAEFMLARADVQIPQSTQEYAINASNYRYWDKPVRAYVDDCIAGENRPGDSNFNMRWIGSLVAEAYRILARGGIFLYPGDARPGYKMGRLRLVYEANPIALLIEEAGGAATDGARRILDIEPPALHSRVPFVFGSSDHVARITRYHTEIRFDNDESPLFGQRGLFQR